MNRIDEKFFKSGYIKFRNNVIFALKKYNLNVNDLDPKVIHDIEYWIKDYYLDKMGEDECVMAIKDNFRKYCNESAINEDKYMDAMDKELDDIQSEKQLGKAFFDLCDKAEEILGIKIYHKEDGKKRIDGEDVYFAANREENYRGDLVYFIIKQVALDEIKVETHISRNDKVLDHLTWYVYVDEPEKWEEALNDIKHARDEYMTKKSMFKRFLNKITPEEFKTGRLKESVQLLENAGYVVVSDDNIIDWYARQAAKKYKQLDGNIADNFSDEELVEIMKARSDIGQYVSDKIPVSIFAEEMLDIDLMQNCIEAVGL